MQRRRSPSRIGPGLTLTEPSQGRAPTTGFRDPGIELAPSSPRQDAGWAAGWLHKTWPAGRLPTPTSPLGGAQLRPPVGDGEEHAVRVAWAPVGEGSVLATSGVPHEVSGSEHSAVVIGVAAREHEDILWAQVEVADRLRKVVVSEGIQARAWGEGDRKALQEPGEKIDKSKEMVGQIRFQPRSNLARHLLP